MRPKARNWRARQCSALWFCLRNQQALLPLDKRQIRSIAVIGPLADAELDLLGMWGAMTKPGPTVSILQGIKNKVGGAVRVEFAHGPNISRNIPSFFEDVAIVHVKEQPQQTPEQARKALGGRSCNG